MFRLRGMFERNIILNKMKSERHAIYPSFITLYFYRNPVRIIRLIVCCFFQVPFEAANALIRRVRLTLRRVGGGLRKTYLNKPASMSSILI